VFQNPGLFIHRLKLWALARGDCASLEGIAKCAVRSARICLPMWKMKRMSISLHDSVQLFPFVAKSGRVMAHEEGGGETASYINC
jgi:hypothetical protein